MREQRQVRPAPGRVRSSGGSWQYACQVEGCPYQSSRRDVSDAHDALRLHLAHHHDIGWRECLPSLIQHALRQAGVTYSQATEAGSVNMHVADAPASPRTAEDDPPG